MENCTLTLAELITEFSTSSVSTARFLLSMRHAGLHRAHSEFHKGAARVCNARVIEFFNKNTCKSRVMCGTCGHVLSSFLELLEFMDKIISVDC
jgi:hypothetical protein